ncbi:MAG: MliC family protein [Jhaorihella sp.]
MIRAALPAVACGIVFGFTATAGLAQTQIVEVTYACDRGVELSVRFINPPGEAGIAVMAIEGKLVALRAISAASGVRYVATDEQDSYRLYTKGDEAFVAWMAADHTAGEVTILGGCRAAPQ